jgi:hypothetical protein
VSLLAQWRSGDRKAAGRLLQLYYHETREILASRGAQGDDLDAACERLWDGARDHVVDGDPFRSPDDGEVLRELARLLPLAGLAYAREQAKAQLTRDAAAEKLAQLGDLARRNLLTEEELQRLNEEARLRRALAALEQEMAKLTAAVARLTGQTESEVDAAANVQGNEYARERASAQGVVLEPLAELCLSLNGALVWLRAQLRRISEGGQT